MLSLKTVRIFTSFMDNLEIECLAGILVLKDISSVFLSPFAPPNTELLPCVSGFQRTL